MKHLLLAVAMAVETSEQEEGPEVYSSKARAGLEVTSAAARFGVGKMVGPVSSPVAC